MDGQEQVPVVLATRPSVVVVDSEVDRWFNENISDRVEKIVRWEYGHNDGVDPGPSVPVASVIDNLATKCGLKIGTLAMYLYWLEVNGLPANYWTLHIPLEYEPGVHDSEIERTMRWVYCQPRSRLPLDDGLLAAIYKDLINSGCFEEPGSAVYQNKHLAAFVLFGVTFMLGILYGDYHTCDGIEDCPESDSTEFLLMSSSEYLATFGRPP